MYKRQHRHLSDIYEIIDKSSLNEYVKENAKKIFMVIAEAEAKVHGTTIDKIHFHEVGAIDSIVDVVSACILVDLLCVDTVSYTHLDVYKRQILNSIAWRNFKCNKINGIRI